MQIACGKNHTLALSYDCKRLYAWGDGECGKLGLGSTTLKVIPNLVENLRNDCLKKIACGSKFSVVLSANGYLYTFGHGMFKTHFVYLLYIYLQNQHKSIK